MRRAVPVVAGILSGASLLASGGPPQRTNSPSSASVVISGRVVDGATDAGVGPAVVTLSPWFPEGATIDLWQRSESFLSSEDGRFEIESSLPGTFSVPALFRVSAWYRGSHGEYGARRAKVAGRFLRLIPGQALGDVVIPIWHLGEITGTVFGDDGQPMPYVRVAAVAEQAVTNPWSEQQPDTCFGPRYYTDDRGRYRIDDLAPGSYFVFVPLRLPPCRAHLAPPPLDAALPDRLGPERPADRNGVARTYLSTFVPDARSLDSARVIHVRGGEETGGADIHLQAAASFAVAGRIADACPDDFAPDVSLRPSSLRDLLRISTWSTRARRGSFRFRDVPSGQYALRVRCIGGGRGANIAVEVNKSIEGLTVPLHSGTTLTGRVVAPDGGPVRLGRLTSGFTLIPIERAHDLDREFIDVSEAGIFEQSVLPGSYWLSAALQDRSQIIERITIDGRDVAHTALTVGATGPASLIVTVVRGATLTGRLDPSDGSANAHILVFPADPTLWPRPDPVTSFELRGFLRARSTPDGTYTAGPLPSGEYFVAAVPDSTGWPLAEFLTTVAPGAVRVRLNRGETRTLPLRVSEP